jgi:adenylosuccinate synthase
LGRGSIGTTGKGIGPTYSSKASRSGIRVHHLYEFEEFSARFRTMVENKRKRYGNFEYDVEAELERYRELAERVRPYVIDTIPYLHEQIKAGKRILVEGANALMLDIDFGTYPYVTSSTTSIGGVCTGLGVPPNKVSKVIGVVKAYCTRVGGGPFPSEQLNEIGEHLQTVGFEFGVTTGRKRRCGWLDLVVVNYSNMINGYTSFNLTKLDILDQLPTIKVAVAYHLDGKKLPSFPADLDLLEKVEVEYVELPGWQTDISKCTKYENLPENAKKYIAFIEKETGVPVEWIGVGPGREAMIHKPVSN